MEGEKSVGDIQESCGASQSAVSQYLKGLRLEGLIDHRREGKKIFYRIIDKKVLQLIQSLYQVFCRWQIREAGLYGCDDQLFRSSFCKWDGGQDTASCFRVRISFYEQT